MREARSASLPILHPASSAAFLGPVLEPLPGRREGTESVVSASASSGEGGTGGGMTACVIPPWPFFLVKMGHGSAAWCLLHGLLWNGLKIPLKSPKTHYVSWLCHAGCAVLCCAGYTMVGVAAQALPPALCLCQVQAGTKAKANRSPGGPSGDCYWVSPQPWDSPWPQDSPWPLALPLLWCLAAAEHSSSVLPHGPWPQIRRGTGLGVAPTGAGSQADRGRESG